MKTNNLASQTATSEKYRTSNTNANSQKYGNCEVCDKPCSEVWYLVEIKKSANSYFGHASCLLEKLKDKLTFPVF